MNVYYITLIIIWWLLLRATSAVPSCKPNWILHGYYCYKTLDSNKYRTNNVQEGRKWCKQHADKDSDLPIFREKQDLNFYKKKTFKDIFKQFAIDFILLGAEWIAGSSKNIKIYKWYDGTAVSNHGDNGFQNWANDEPRVYFKPEKNEESAMVFHKATGEWYTIATSSKKNVVMCQMVAENSNGRWGQWNPGKCSKTCGKGTQTRHRTCNDPAPTGNGKNCETTSKGGTDKIACEVKSCPSNNSGLIIGIVLLSLLVLLLLAIIMALCYFCYWRKRGKQNKEAEDEKVTSTIVETKSVSSKTSSQKDVAMTKKSTEILGFDTKNDQKSEEESSSENKIEEEENTKSKNVKTKKRAAKKATATQKSPAGLRENRASRLTTIKKRF